MLNLKMVSTLLNRKPIATGTAVVAMLSRNIGTIFFQLMAGPIIDTIGLNYLYLLLFVFTVIAAVIALLFKVPAQPKERLFLDNIFNRKNGPGIKFPGPLLFFCLRIYQYLTRLTHQLRRFHQRNRYKSQPCCHTKLYQAEVGRYRKDAAYRRK